MELKVINTDGKEIGSVTVRDEIFDVEYNESVVHQVVVAQLANKRQGTKSTLTRTEVRGGGIKPWRQKGTGRARQGSIRAPQWRHGGVVFAPKPRDFSKKVNVKVKQQALCCVLSEKVRANEFVVLDCLKLAEAKTKLMANICKNIDAGKKAMFVIAGSDATVQRAINNLPEASLCDASLINVYDLVRAGKVFITKDALARFEEDNQ